MITPKSVTRIFSNPRMKSSIGLRYIKSKLRTNLKKKIKILRSDHVGKYTSNDMKEFCQEHDIIHEVTAPYTPQSNGIAERKNRTLMDMVNYMLLSSGTPENF